MSITCPCLSRLTTRRSWASTSNLSFVSHTILANTFTGSWGIFRVILALVVDLGYFCYLITASWPALSDQHLLNPPSQQTKWGLQTWFNSECVGDFERCCMQRLSINSGIPKIVSKWVWTLDETKAPEDCQRLIGSISVEYALQSWIRPKSKFRRLNS